MNQKTAIVSVINDLVSDQRVHRTCTALQEKGYRVLLVGRKLHNSLPINREYKTHRMRLLFVKGPLFYAEYNVRLFLFLLFKKADLLFSNDLDTLLSNYLISKFKGATLLYDAHEYFTEVPELENNAFKKNIWKRLEKWVIPGLKQMITVNDSIAQLYKKEYQVKVEVIRNVPESKSVTPKTRKELNLPEDKKIILLQGAGINIQRGAEEAVECMQYLNGCILLIIGGGDVIEQLKTKAVQLKLNEKIVFINRLPFEQLRQYTQVADVGLSLDKDTNLNYRYSLPNKLFDYIHAGIPVVTSPLVEVKKIVEQYQIGKYIENHQPQHLAQIIESVVFNPGLYQQLKSNTTKAAQELCWEKEKAGLLNLL